MAANPMFLNIIYRAKKWIWVSASLYSDTANWDNSYVKLSKSSVILFIALSITATHKEDIFLQLSSSMFELNVISLSS